MEIPHDFGDQIEEDLRLQTEAWEILKKYEGVDPSEIPIQERVVVALYVSREQEKGDDD